jgi:heterodisulfide reductase subunit C
MPPKTEAELRSAFWDQVATFPDGYKIRNCIQCGSCTASCPVAPAMDVSPRQLVALFRAGFLEDVLKSRSIWLCASCYACTVRCPAGIRVTDNIYALKRLAKRKKLLPAKFPAQALSEAFARNLHRYGRNWETWLGIEYYLRASPAKLFAGHVRRFALGMLRRGRLPLRPRRIRGIQEIRAIVRRAEAIGGL